MKSALKRARLAGRTLAVTGAVLLTAAAPAAAKHMPSGEGVARHCVSDVRPPMPVAGAPPAIRAWSGRWVTGETLARCGGWGEWQPAMAVALAGDLRIDGGTDVLLERIGAVGALRGMKYWSIGNQVWQTLITAASALSAPDSEARRPDFTAAELRAGEPLYFVQHDNRSTGGVIYRMRVTMQDEDRIVIDVENVSSVGFLFVSAFEPRNLRSMHVLRRVASDRWEYFSLSGARESRSGALGAYSFVNRVVAYYRHLAGIPGDREPPAVPR